jgi:hypothetical protein
MMLLADGTVMAQDNGAAANNNRWYRLTPASNGSYASGTWSSRAPMSLQRLYFGSNVLNDAHGRVFVVGGEYSGSSLTNNWTNTGEIYDPVTNTWSAIPNFPQSQFGDDPTKVLPNGRVFAGYLGGPQTYIYNPVSNSWSATGTKLNGDRSDEETWVKLNDNSILTYDIFALGHAQRYVPSTGQWVDAGAAQNNLTSSAVGEELGPAFLLPDGRVFYIGATGHTAFYTPSSNTWASGPDVPSGLGADDAPGAELPNGKILFAADTPLFHGPTHVFEFDPTANTYTDVTPSVSGLSTGGASYTDRMLVLPTGQVLFGTGGNKLAVYTPDGSPVPAGKPTIASITANADGSYTLTGQTLSGINEGAAYGDDAEMDSNYPLVQLTGSDGHVHYARTHEWNATGVGATNGATSTKFDLPTGLASGTYSLRVISNGIASDPASFAVGTGATHLAFTAQPTNVRAGAAISPAVQVAVEDANGNVVSTDNSSITVALGNNPVGGTLSGTLTVAAVNGVATFSSLSVNRAGVGYTLAASDGSLMGATSSAFDVTPGPVTWVNAAGGDWDTPGNWSTGTVPGPSDDTVINLAGITVTHASPVADAVHSLTSQAGLVLTAGSLSLAMASSLHDSLTLSGNAVLTGAVNVTVGGLFTWTGGTLGGSGSLTAQGGMMIDSTGAQETLDTRTLVNAGSASWTGVAGNPFAVLNGATFTNQAGATLDLQGSVVLYDPTNPLSRGVFNNAGTLTVEASADVGCAVSVPFNNGGVVSLTSGTLSLGDRYRGAPSTSSGLFTAAGGTTLAFVGPQTFTASSSLQADQVHFGTSADGVSNDATVNGTYTAAGGTTVEFSNVTFPAGAGVTSLGNLSVFNGTARFAGAVGSVGNVTVGYDPGFASVPSGTVTFGGSVPAVGDVMVDARGMVNFLGSLGGIGSLTLTNSSGDPTNGPGGSANFSPAGGPVTLAFNNLFLAGTLSGVDSFTVNGFFTWTDGTLEGPPGSTLTALGGMTLGQQQVITHPLFLDGRTLANAGTAAWNSTGGVSLTHQAVFNNLAGATILDLNTRSGDGFADADGSGAAFNNLGAYVKSGTALSSMTLAFTNSGTVDVQAGTLGFGTYTQTAGTTLLDGGSLAGALNLQGGTLMGSGTIMGNVTNAGLLVVGFPGVPGTLVITGDYTQTAAGVLTLEVGGYNAGIDYGHLQVGGTAALGGTLNVNLINGFVPNPGDSFALLTFTAVAGGFATVSLPSGATLLMDPGDVTVSF